MIRIYSCILILNSTICKQFSIKINFIQKCFQGCWLLEEFLNFKMDVSAKSLLETETNNQSYLQPQQALYQNFSKIKKNREP